MGPNTLEAFDQRHSREQQPATIDRWNGEHYQSPKRLFRKRRSRLPSRTKDTRSRDIARRAH